MNEPNKMMPTDFALRPQLLSKICLALAIFVTALWLISLMFHAVAISAFWPWFAVALVVYASVRLAVKYGLSKPQAKRWPIFITVFLSISVITLILGFLTGGISHILDYADFYFIREQYLKKVALAPHTNAPRFIAFDWKIGGADQYLYFDETDELDKPSQPKSRDWWLRAKKTHETLTTTDWDSRKVAAHFYVVQFYVYEPYLRSPIPSLDQSK